MKYLAMSYVTKGNSTKLAGTRLSGTLPAAWKFVDAKGDHGHVVELTRAGAKLAMLDVNSILAK